VFSVDAPNYEAAVTAGIDALQQALPGIQIRSALPGRDPGEFDIV
jgi:hypothetical protein